MALLEGHSVVEYRERLYFFGGRDSVTGMILNTLWMLPIADIAKARAQRPEETAAITARADRRVPLERDAFGGFSPPPLRGGASATPRADGATADSSSSPTTVGSRPRRSAVQLGGETAAKDDAEARGMLAAAEDVQRQAYAASFTNPLPVVAPRPVHCTGHVPTARCYHQCCVRDAFMLIVGGTTVRDISKAATSTASDDSYLRDDLVLWALNLDSLVWNKYYLPGAHSTVPRFNGAPLPRCHATLTATPDSALLFGGFPVDPSAPPLPNHWALFEINEDAEARALPCAGDSPTLWGHTAAFAHGCLFVFGGVDSTSMSEVNTLCVYSFTEHRWRWADFALAPEPRALHSCAAAGSKLYVFGGFSGRPDRQHYPHLGDTWSFCLNSGLWEEVQASGDIPPARSGHAAIVHGGIMYVCGGLEGNAAEQRGVATLCALDINAAHWTNYRLLFDDATLPAVQADMGLDLLDETAKQAPAPVWPTLRPNAQTPADERAASSQYRVRDGTANSSSPTRVPAGLSPKRGGTGAAASGSPKATPSAAEQYILDSLAAVRSAAPVGKPSAFVRGNGAGQPATVVLSPPGKSPFADVASLVKTVQSADERANFAAADTKRDVQQWQDANARRSHLGRIDDTMPYAFPPSQNVNATNVTSPPTAHGNGENPDEFLARLERQRRAAFDAYGSAALSPTDRVLGASNREGGALAAPGRPSAPQQAALRSFDEPTPEGRAAAALRQRRPSPSVDAELQWRQRQQREAQSPPDERAFVRHAAFVPSVGAFGQQVDDDEALPPPPSQQHHDPPQPRFQRRSSDDGPSWATAEVPVQHSATSVRYGDRQLTDRLQSFAPVQLENRSTPQRRYSGTGFRGAQYADPNAVTTTLSPEERSGREERSSRLNPDERRRGGEGGGSGVVTSPVQSRLSFFDVTSTTTPKGASPAAAGVSTQSVSPPNGGLYNPRQPSSSGYPAPPPPSSASPSHADDLLSPARAAYLRRARLNPA